MNAPSQQRYTAPDHPALKNLLEQARPLREKLLAHPLYGRVQRLEDLRIFVEHHVFAVWDFMSLLKWLQRELTCVSVPWRPVGDPLIRRLINEIVLEEESGEDETGLCTSHFELYLRAMDQCGAASGPVRDFLQRIADGAKVPAALAASDVPLAARRFVEATWSVLDSRSPHRVAAAFAVGRENVVPGMFRAILGGLDPHFSGQLTILRHYLDRQISLDEERHFPIAQRMLLQVCADQPEYWREASAAATSALAARLALWDGVLAQIQERTLGD